MGKIAREKKALCKRSPNIRNKSSGVTLTRIKIYTSYSEAPNEYFRKKGKYICGDGSTQGIVQSAWRIAMGMGKCRPVWLRHPSTKNPPPQRGRPTKGQALSYPLKYPPLAPPAEGNRIIVVCISPLSLFLRKGAGG